MKTIKMFIYSYFFIKLNNKIDYWIMQIYNAVIDK